MKRICPKPIIWNEAFKRLTRYARMHQCTPPAPPTPLILNGWVYSNDIEKLHRWEETIAWAENNGCIHLVSCIPEDDFYFVHEPTNYEVGPMGGPMYLPWDYKTKNRPSSEQISKSMGILLSRWHDIIGPELSKITRPKSFTGEKARRLLVSVIGEGTPPWGGWFHLSKQESARRAFTRFRKAVNETIAPHEVDHIDFTK